MADKKLSPEEKKKIEEERKKLRDTALKTLKLAYWEYALPELVQKAQYGADIPRLAEEKYSETVSKTPSQEVYDELFAKPLKSKAGAVTSGYLQNASIQILNQAFQNLTLKDILEYVGSKKALNKDYEGKYVSDLKDEEAGSIVNLCLTYTSKKKVAELIGSSTSRITSGLEEMLAEPDKAEKKAA